MANNNFGNAFKIEHHQSMFITLHTCLCINHYSPGEVASALEMLGLPITTAAPIIFTIFIASSRLKPFMAKYSAIQV